MTTKMKGICKGFKCISHFFVVKEHEMEIGYPTDVKHVAHIGWDCPGSSPSWMNEFKPGPDFSVPTMGNISQPREPNRVAVSPWSSQDFEQPIGHPPVTQVFKDRPPTDLPKAPRKQKRKKIKSTSSPKASPSSRSSRAAKFKAKQAEADAVVNL